MKTAVIFPGIGYHTDKPLLYYSKKQAVQCGYEIIDIRYSDLPKAVRNDSESMNAAFEAAYSQAVEQLNKLDFSASDEVLFIEKSLGTLVGFRYSRDNALSNVKHMCFTPVPETFEYIDGGTGIIFHGLNDPWCESSIVYEAYRNLVPDYRLLTFENANHSLETGNVKDDIQIIKHIAELSGRFIFSLHDMTE